MNKKKMVLMLMAVLLGLTTASWARVNKFGIDPSKLTADQKAQYRALNQQRKKKVASIRSAHAPAMARAASDSDKAAEKARMRAEVKKINDDFRAQAKKIAGQ